MTRTDTPSETELLHATTVAVDGRAVVIRGASGEGKSSLALQLIALGAKLVADDRTLLEHRGTEIWADVPPSLEGKIEARHVGILNCPTSGPCPVALVVDLDHTEHDRLPPDRKTTLAGMAVPLICGSRSPHFAAAVLLYVRHGRES